MPQLFISQVKLTYKKFVILHYVTRKQRVGFTFTPQDQSYCISAIQEFKSLWEYHTVRESLPNTMDNRYGLFALTQ